ncbi:EpsD family peptidyl-prolyl cis-trans isomerase [Ideonella sp. BN130291]|uniref:EpsD family peptidyl-prolyl cis-trans isomerase n=1 Tax=Ideonella sp. BN130291 TaxID=3112940 RepID=UPI002E255AB4|nr:EpsD family peptidyl-prolyl cis-trans isomerase [Ideonella sp. BN130291]
MNMHMGTSRTVGTVSRVALIASVCVLVALTGCSKKEKGGASQTAAKVNKQEITVHQINFVLQQQRGLRQEQMEPASRQVLERLIDQELALQKAEELKLDRDPRVVQQLEAARREIIARAYVEKSSEGVAKPTAEEVKKYYDDHPARYKERHVYSVQELNIEAKPEQVASVKALVDGGKPLTEIVDFLKANQIRYAANQVVRGSEQLPAPSLDLLARMKDGQMVLNGTPIGAQIVLLAASRLQPVTLEQATPAIEQAILGERKRDLVAKNLQQLRADAKIEYVGKFKDGAAGAAADAASAAPLGDAAAPAAAEPTAAAPAPSAAPAPAAPAPAASAGLDTSSITKGLGIK